MTEQEQVHIEYDKNQGTKIISRQNFPAWIVFGGLVLSAIILAGAVLFSSSFIAKSLKGSSGSLAAIQVPTGQNVNPGQPTAPTGPVEIKSRSGEPVMGNKNAKVTIVEFADFQCPYCKQYFQNTFEQIKKNYIDTGKVKYVYRHFPLTQIHQNAEIAAVAAECANEQGKFWEMHDVLFKNGQSDGTGLDKTSLDKYGNDLGLNKGTMGFGKNKFSQCLQNPETLKIVQADNTEGVSAGVSGTPSFFVNGVQLVGAQPYTAFQQAIESALSK
jgi:protein-disulfide isomerase